MESARRINLNHRSLTGRVSTDKGSSAFESSLERDWLILLDFDRSVVGFIEQPFTIPYSLGNQARRYTPDVMVEYEVGPSRAKTVVYEVKYRDDLQKYWQDFHPRFRAANHYCRERGWTFSIMTEREVRTPRLDNATFLRRYRTIPDQPLVRMQLLYTLQALGPTTPQALLAATYTSETSRMPALAILWNLIATGKIAADLSKPLTMKSTIQSVDG